MYLYENFDAVINIIIIEQNKIFRESLKTALEQIPDFRIVVDMDNKGNLQSFKNVKVDLILIDYNLGENICNEIINETLSVNPDVKFLLLVGNTIECNFTCFKTIDTILRNSTKKEIENKIMELSIK